LQNRLAYNATPWNHAGILKDMLPIPENISIQFDHVLRQRAIPVSLHVHYRKWLRFFIDFCEKYPPPKAKSEQVRLFIEKLKSKKQTQKQCSQAAHAISLFFESQKVVRELHDKDLAAGYAGVFLPDLLEKKYPAAARDFIWQWFFHKRGSRGYPEPKNTDAIICTNQRSRRL
jgi:hypothetical protein